MAASYLSIVKRTASFRRKGQGCVGLCERGGQLEGGKEKSMLGSLQGPWRSTTKGQALL